MDADVTALPYTELLMSESVGQVGENIMFSSNDTPAEEFALADKLGAIINLDDITHIDFLEKTIGKIPETISCRYNPVDFSKFPTALWIIREMPNTVCDN